MIKFPKKTKELYDNVYNKASMSYTSERANKIALTVVRDSLSTVKFDFVADTASISKDENGYSYVDYGLSSNRLDAHGTKFDNFALTNMVDQINKEGLVGDVDEDVHSEWNKLKAQGYTPAQIEEILQSRDTGIKAISARIDKNKVVARLRVRSDLMSKVMQYKGASVEARVPYEAVQGNTFKQARLQSFILTNTPSNPDAYRQ